MSDREFKEGDRVVIHWSRGITRKATIKRVSKTVTPDGTQIEVLIDGIPVPYWYGSGKLTHLEEPEA